MEKEGEESAAADYAAAGATFTAAHIYIRIMLWLCP
jgi:hypothetical protein